MPAPAARIVDQTKLAKLLGSIKAGDTGSIDLLIERNDGIADHAKEMIVPPGYVAVGPNRKLVKLNVQAKPSIDVSFWTAGLHYNQNGLQAGLSTSPPTASVYTPANLRMPWDLPRLWSNDAKLAVRQLGRVLSRIAARISQTLDDSAAVIDSLTWTSRQADRLWYDLTMHVRHDLWLAWIPAGERSLPIQSAERRPSDNR
jgi:hypothetical protein